MSDIGKSLTVSWKELGCREGTPYPVSFIRDGRVIELVVMFEKIRQHFGSKPIIINSAYRTKAYNKSVGGSPNSQHMFGRALDIQPPKGVNINTFHAELLLNAKWMGIRGLGKYKTFCHVDLRDVKELVTWDMTKT
jgi:uncharacterized protein YcbK (DUF882 family)